VLKYVSVLYSIFQKLVLLTAPLKFQILERQRPQIKGGLC